MSSWALYYYSNLLSANGSANFDARCAPIGYGLMTASYGSSNTEPCAPAHGFESWSSSLGNDSIKRCRLTSRDSIFILNHGPGLVPSCHLSSNVPLIPGPLITHHPPQHTTHQHCSHHTPHIICSIIDFQISGLSNVHQCIDARKKMSFMCLCKKKGTPVN